MSKGVANALQGYTFDLLGVTLITGLIYIIPGAQDVTNRATPYLLVVIAAAYRFGRGAAIVAAILSVMATDWFFQEPRYTLGANNPADWLELIMLLTTATVISQLTTLLRQRAEEASQSEREAAALSQISWAVASQVRHDLALSEVLRSLLEMVPGVAAAIIIQGANGVPEVVAAGGEATALPDFTAPIARAALDALHAAGASRKVEPLPTDVAGLAFPQSLTMSTATNALQLRSGIKKKRGSGGVANAPPDIYLPLAMEERMLGALYLRLDEAHTISNAQRRIVASLLNYATVALERQRLTRLESQTRALSEADRLKTALLSMVSHDFRSPLASIKASATGLLQEGVPWDATTQRELLLGINQETDRLNRMVGNILALSRLEAGDWRPQCELVPLDEVIGAALDSFSADDNERIQTAIDPTLVEVWVDSVQIAQVLHNLIENALKYSPPASPVELRACPEWGSADNENLLMEVLDRGPGLTEEEKAHVFERFYRSPRWHESSLPGTGIGLAICSGLVEAHQGQLVADNRAGGGAVFRIRLPLRAPQPLLSVALNR